MMYNGKVIPPADSAFASDHVTLSIVQAEVVLHVTDALAWQTVHAQIPGITNAFSLARPLVHHTSGKVVTRLELAGIGSVT